MTGGYIRSTDGSHLEAVFYIQGTPWTFNGSLAPPVTPFRVSQANLAYTAQLAAQRSFTGSVGPNQVSLTFGDYQTKITGNLDSPIAVYNSTVSGNGTWSA